MLVACCDGLTGFGDAIQLRWLALLLVRTIENSVGEGGATSSTNSIGCSWSRSPRLTGPPAYVITPGQKRILDALDLDEPPRYYDFTPFSADQPA